MQDGVLQSARGGQTLSPRPSTANANQETRDRCESMQRGIRFFPDIAHKLIE
jgi:hypothetical protein